MVDAKLQNEVNTILTEHVLKGGKFSEVPGKTYEVASGIKALDTDVTRGQEASAQQADSSPQSGKASESVKESEAKGEDNDYSYGMGQ